jgi:Cu+-exporting ATPase
MSNFVRRAALVGLSATLMLALPAAAADDAEKKQSKPAAAAKVTDPVCGMELEPKAAAAKSQYQGKTYYFCAKEEKEQFDKSPTNYVKTASKPKKAS